MTLLCCHAPGKCIVNSWRTTIPVGSGCKWPVCQLWLLSAVADGTQRHEGQRYVYAPPKILILGGRLHLHLPQQISAHVAEEAAAFGREMHFWLQEVIEERYSVILGEDKVRKTENQSVRRLWCIRKHHHVGPSSFIATAFFWTLTLSSWTYVGHRTVSVTLRENHLLFEHPVFWCVRIQCFLFLALCVCSLSLFICNMCGHVDPGGFG